MPRWWLLALCVKRRRTHKSTRKDCAICVVFVIAMYLQTPPMSFQVWQLPSLHQYAYPCIPTCPHPGYINPNPAHLVSAQMERSHCLELLLCQLCLSSVVTSSSFYYYSSTPMSASLYGL
ncbi:hypothetical protein Plhal703r1_c03g0014281 [Plasmopara halstedii]